ncbi:MAG: MurR/RpiR family transcriptional regulator, partial [Ruthenibacterium sp.]
MQSCVKQIKQNYAALRASERKVADYVLLHAQEIPHCTMSALSAAVQVSEPTVLRFVHAAGFGGFREMKLAFAQDMVRAPQRAPLVDVHVAQGDALKSVPEKMITLAVRALEDTRRMLDDKQYARAVKAIAGARLIDVYGVGNSAAVAADMVTKLLRIGLPCRNYSDSHLQQICASALQKGDVAIGVSHSGATRDTVDALSMARARGATTIAITNFKG